MNRMLSALSDLFSSPNREYTTRIANGRLVVEIPLPNGKKLHIGNIVDAEYFPAEWFNQHEIAMLNAKDGSVQKVMRQQNPRKNSGLFPHSHIYEVFKEGVTIAQQAGLRIDLPTGLMLIGHDFYEDNPWLESLIKKWENAVVEDNNSLAERLHERITHRRNQMRIAHGNDLEKIAQSLEGMTEMEWELLSAQIKEAERGNFNLTRFHNNTYAKSIDFQYSRQRNEALIRTMRRMLVKNVDTIRNNEEVGPLEKKVMDQVYYAFEDEREFHGHVIGQELKRRYGTVDREAQEMPRSRKLRRGFTSVLKILSMNHFENKYGRGIFYSEDPQEREYHQLLLASRKRLVQTTFAILEASKSKYEAEGYVKKHRKDVDKEVGRWHRDEKYLHVESGNAGDKGGIVIPMILGDARGQRYFERLERENSGLMFCYRAVRHTLELLKLANMFHDGISRNQYNRPIWNPDRSQYDPSGIHRLFEIKNYKVGALGTTPNIKSILEYGRT